MRALKRLGTRSYFANLIPNKKDIKCCRYEQNGKPMSPDQAEQIYGTLRDLIQGWRLNDEKTRLFRYFFTEDYQSAIKFITEVAQLDQNTTRNCPSFSLKGGQILTLELFSPPLDGLSQVDFELAMNINNNINFQKFFLIDISDLTQYKKEVTATRLKRQSEEIQRELAQQKQL